MQPTVLTSKLTSSAKNELLRGILEDYYYEHLSFQELSARSSLSKSTVYRWIRTFESENPQMCEQMKKKGNEVTPDDYKRLLREVCELKKQLCRERLRADFYEEMVAFGKEVYGIDLKKAGTK